MKILFVICGLLWIFYGVGFLALSASVVSAPTHMMTLRNISYFIIGIFFINGIYFIKTGMDEKKKRIHKICNHAFYRLLIKNKYKMHVSELANKINIRIEDAVEYTESRMKITIGILRFDKSGNINIGRLKAKEN